MCKPLVIVILLFSLVLKSQVRNDTLDKYNEKFKKQGYWLIYLTERLIPTKDTSKAYFYAYNYFDNGVQVGFFPIANPARKSAARIDYHGLEPVKGKIILLSGHITYFDRDSISLDEVYWHGIPVSRQGFFWNKKRNCRYKQTLDYRHAYKKETGSFYYEYINYEDSIKKITKVALAEKIWYRKKTNTWRLYDDTKFYNNDFGYGPVRYQIDPLDRNGKGPSFLKLIRREIKPVFIIGYEQMHISDQWLKGANLGVIAINPYTRLAISFNYSFVNGNSPKNYGVYKANSVSLLERRLGIHYFFIYNKHFQSSIFVDVVGDDYFMLDYTRPDGTRHLATNNTFETKPGLWASMRLRRGISLYGQVFYRQVFNSFPIHLSGGFGKTRDFSGLGFSVGLLFR